VCIRLKSAILVQGQGYEGQMVESACLVRFISSYFVSIFMNLVQKFNSLRQCSKGISQPLAQGQGHTI